MSTEKPPTQYAGVVGIEPKPIVLTPEPAIGIFWPGVAGLPPFQMFAAERARNASGKDSLGHALDLVHARSGTRDLFNEYADWHLAKGYWPGETPLGEAK